MTTLEDRVKKLTAQNDAQIERLKKATEKLIKKGEQK